ncbi:hypothetical protein [Dyella psychrodurans]|uniref:Uncharacterized protein n=1 Tax=Dyella psychrodurans TaxID=1927960 RepID=A0A370XCG8_9GAMM|nr:hypothetical protein [Dyella psychrodurans]RDS85915.1 hypothetical protein DWU99_01155 [Dyella psychrodurans]
MDVADLTVNELALGAVTTPTGRSLVDRVENLVILAETPIESDHPAIAISNMLHHTVRIPYEHLLRDLPDDARDPILSTRLDRDGLKAMGRLMMEVVDGLVANPPAALPWLAQLADDRRTKHYLMDALLGRLMMRVRLALQSGRWADRPQRSDSILDVACSVVELEGVQVGTSFLAEALVCTSADGAKRYAVVIVLRTVHNDSTARPEVERRVRTSYEEDPAFVRPVIVYTVDLIDGLRVPYSVIEPLSRVLMNGAEDIEDQIDNLIIATSAFGRLDGSAPPTPLMGVVVQHTVGLLTGLIAEILQHDDPMNAWVALNAQAYGGIVHYGRAFLEDIAERDPTDPILSRLQEPEDDDEEDSPRSYWAEMFGVHGLARLQVVIASGAWTVLRERTNDDPNRMAMEVLGHAEPLVRVERDDDGEVTMQRLDGWVVIAPRDGSMGKTRSSGVMVLGRRPVDSQAFLTVAPALEAGAYEGAPGVRLDPSEQHLSTLFRPAVY